MDNSAFHTCMKLYDFAERKTQKVFLFMNEILRLNRITVEKRKTKNSNYP